MTHHATEPADLCARLSQAADEPAIGTAAEASCWVVLEQNGPWGSRAATQSRLDPELGATLDAAATAVGGRFALLRHPGTHSDAHRSERRILLAGGPIDSPWLLTGTVTGPARLLDLPWDRLGDPSPAHLLAALPELQVSTESILLVCTNGKRDRCCAILARPVVEAAHRAHPGRVYETTHLGGHRFATTAVVLPTGHTYARLTAKNVSDVLSAADRGQVPDTLADARHYRGRSGLSRPAQVAEYAVRVARDDWSLPGPGVGEPVPAGPDRWDVPATQAGGQPVRMVVQRAPSDRLRPESCGKPPAPLAVWQVAAEDRTRAE